MHDPTAPLAAIITAAKSDTLVNLCVFDAEGSPLGFQNVQLLQDDAEPTLDKEGKPTGSFAMWMPYQKGQASKTEALESQLQSELGALKNAAAAISDAAPAAAQPGSASLAAPPAAQAAPAAK
jgi:hypothetical protein